MAWIFQELGRGGVASALARQTQRDLERGWEWVSEEEAGRYLHRWGWIVYRLGNASQGRDLLEHALEAAQESERAFFAGVLSTLALVYHGIGQPKRALELYEQALLISREVGDRAREVVTLNNLAGVYHEIGQPKRALEYYAQALPISREVGDRAGEAATLNGLGFLYQDMQCYPEALDAFDASIHLAQETLYPTAEIAGLVARSQVLYAHLERPQDAIRSLDQALVLFETTGLSHDAAGRTPEDIAQLLERMRQDQGRTNPTGPATLSASALSQLVENTRAVLSEMPEHKATWEEQVRELLAHAHAQGEDWQAEAELFTALLALLAGNEAHLPDGHPYHAAIEAIQQEEEHASSPSIADSLL